MDTDNENTETKTGLFIDMATGDTVERELTNEEVASLIDDSQPLDAE